MPEVSATGRTRERNGEAKGKRVDMTPLGYLLVAFAVLAWGYGLYRLVRRQVRRERDPDDLGPGPGGPLGDW